MNDLCQVFVACVARTDSFGVDRAHFVAWLKLLKCGSEIHRHEGIGADSQVVSKLTVITSGHRAHAHFAFAVSQPHEHQRVLPDAAIILRWGS